MEHQKNNLKIVADKKSARMLITEHAYINSEFV
jgi:hypothetical protein